MKGNPFPQVMGEFLDWCGEDYIFCTWGTSDLVEKFTHDLRKRIAFHQVTHVKMNYFAGDIMHFRINLGLYQLIEFVYHIAVLTQFYRTNINNFKGYILDNHFHCVIIALIPF
jgi:hypothetical protein